MNINPAASQSLYSYQTALAANGQGSATLGALSQAYSDAQTSNGSTDPLASLVGQTNAGSLASAIYTVSQAQQTSDTSGVQGLAPSQVVGGLDASSATALLTGLSTDAASGLQGFDVTGSSTLAATASQAKQAYGNGNLSSDAQDQTTKAEAAQNGSSASSANDAATAATSPYLQLAVQTAQHAAMTNTFNMLA